MVVAGPEGSPFEGGVFKLELFLPEDYPMSAPKVYNWIFSLILSTCVILTLQFSPCLMHGFRLELENVIKIIVRNYIKDRNKAKTEHSNLCCR